MNFLFFRNASQISSTDFFVKKSITKISIYYSLIIEKDQKILIPIYAIHYDSNYYTDPEKFIPERFTAEEKAKRPNGIYLPFGDGPRICIGVYIFK